ncbi:glycosyltransferase family protein [Pseudogemmobacter bohemicus]|uniref:glycosyltransferase n=1 Tax=Pseudogemmobacter bohemicus TaxID=2250708 RepID=UPI000DD4DCCD|nr:glycosyltransferase [Pseudogemmobacter bohemicus]
MHLVNFSELMGPDWHFPDPSCQVPGVSSECHVIRPGSRSWGLRLNSWSAARRAVRAARARADAVLVSHLPGATLRVAVLAGQGAKHIAFAFNFTDLPQGRKLRAYRAALSRVDEFVVFSNFERDLYSHHFGLPPGRFTFLPWAMEPPQPGPVTAPFDRPWLVALGGEGRDYPALVQAAALCPDLRLVVIARPYNLAGLQLPANVKAFANLPAAEAWGLVQGAAGMLLPLREGRTPNGHITLVGAQMLGVPLAITDSLGVRDYVDASNSLLLPPGDPEALAGAMERLSSGGPDIAALAARAQAAALTRSAPRVWCDWFAAKARGAEPAYSA